jgi:hypothetical protein
LLQMPLRRRRTRTARGLGGTKGRAEAVPNVSSSGIEDAAGAAGAAAADDADADEDARTDADAAHLGSNPSRWLKVRRVDECFAEERLRWVSSTTTTTVRMRMMRRNRRDLTARSAHRVARPRRNGKTIRLATPDGDVRNCLPAKEGRRKRGGVAPFYFYERVQRRARPTRGRRPPINRRQRSKARRALPVYR